MKNDSETFKHLHMEIRRVSLMDLDLVVRIHENAFNHSFLTSLGSRFLRHYYHILLKDKGSTFLGSYNGNELVGFCSIANHSKGYNKRLIKSNLLGFLCLGWNIVKSNPLYIIRLLMNLDKKSSQKDSGEYSEVLSIAVSKPYQGKGIGGKLLKFAEEDLKNQNYTKLSLTTDYHDNDSAIHFYRKNGYEIISDFIAFPKRRMFRLIKTLNLFS